MTQETNLKEIEKLFTAGVHIGHKRNRLHPKARKYVYKLVNGTAIIDLTQTVKQMDEAKSFLKKSAEENKVLLVVATKRIVSQFIAEQCTKNNISYISIKWLPGLLTNFDTLMKNVKKMNDLESAKEKGEWDTFVKHERTKLQKELNRLKRLYQGIKSIQKKPDVMLIVDAKREKNAHIEAVKNKIPVVALTDTNFNPDSVTYPIVGNDDSASAAMYVIQELIDAYAGTRKK